MNDHGCDGHVEKSKKSKSSPPAFFKQRLIADKMPGRASKRTIRVFDIIDPISHDKGPISKCYRATLWFGVHMLGRQSRASRKPLSQLNQKYIQL